MFHHKPKHRKPSLLSKSISTTSTAGLVAGTVILNSHTSTAVTVPEQFKPVGVRVPIVSSVAAHRESPAEYTVKPGDTLWGIADRFFGSGTKWPWLYDANLTVLGPDPNLIYPGQQITRQLGKHAAYGRYSIGESGYRPRHDSDTDTAVPVTTMATRIDPRGNLSCSGLERLWRSAGGRSDAAFVAAEIAMAESGGNQYATGPVGERGYWQINPAAWPASMATYDAYSNARAAVIISDDGMNWSAWTTYTSGAYVGRC